MKILDLYKTTFRFIKECWVVVVIYLVCNEILGLLQASYLYTVGIVADIFIHMLNVVFLIAIFCYMLKGKLPLSGYFKFIKAMPIGTLVVIVVRGMIFNSIMSPRIDYILFEIVRFILFCFITFFIDFFVYCYLLSKSREETSDKLSTQLLREKLKPIMWLRIKSLIVLVVVFVASFLVAYWVDTWIILEAIYLVRCTILLAEMLLAPFIVKSILGKGFTDKKDSHQLHLQN